MPSQWHRLHISQKELPPLLFQYTWTRQGYQIHLTDLTYIWSEQLPRKAIIRRAEENATTIDPAEDPEQLDVLLEKIGEALHKGKEGAILSNGTQTDSIEITTTTKLPSPLKPLKWSLKLSKEPVLSLTRNLLLPLLKEEAEWESRQRFLLDQIKHKDYVLGKLFDKMETLGVDLGTVFPGAAGSRTSRKGVTRSEAARFVKGIAPFEEQEWLDASDGAGLATNLLQEISESDDGVDTISSKGEWWRQLGGHYTSDGDASPIEGPVEDMKEKVETKDADTDVESTASSGVDEFQRQETPPRLKSRNKTSPSNAREKSPAPPALPEEDHEATASDTDNDLDGFQRQETPPRLKSRKETSYSNARDPPALLEEDHEGTASDTDDEPAPAPVRRKPVAVSRSPEPQPRETLTKPKGGLGKIGGKSKKEPESRPQPQPQTSPSLSSPAPPSPPQAKEAPIRPKGKIGKIGGKSKKGAEPSPPLSPSPPSPAPPSPPQAKDTPPKPKPKGILGRIGGKKKKASPPPDHTSPEPQELPRERDSSPPRSPAPKRPGKLGTIGGKAKAKATSPEPAGEDSPVAVPPGKPPAPSTESKSSMVSPLPAAPDKAKARSPAPVEPETEDQRANRKREELKRSLDAKGKAPAKKKRRF